MIGKLQRVPLREIWKHEAIDFTTSLQTNVAEFNEIPGLNPPTATAPAPERGSALVRSLCLGVLTVLSIVSPMTSTGSWARSLPVLPQSHAVEESIGVFHESKHRIIVSGDGRHFAYVTTAEGRHAVVMDGRVGPDFEAIGDLVLSPGGERFAYVAMDSGSYVAMANGIPDRRWDEIAKGTLQFDASDVHLVYVGRKGRKWIAVVDGQPEAEFDGIHVPSLRFSPTGGRLAYSAKLGKATHMVIDGKAGPPWEGVSPPLFSPAGDRMAYVGRSIGTYSVVVDTQIGSQHRYVYSPVFSSNGEHFAYAARDKDGWSIVHDGRPAPSSGEVVAKSLRFSPKGTVLAYGVQKGRNYHVVAYRTLGGVYDKIDFESICFTANKEHVVFTARREGKWFAVVDGRECRGYDWISRLVVSPRGDHVAYSASRDDRSYVILDGREGPPHDQIYRAPVFSPDGKHMAYMARTDSGLVIMLDGIPGEVWEAIESADLAFDDHNNLAYTAADSAAWYGVVGGRRSVPCSAITGPFFSPDGRRTAFVARRNQRWSVIIDNEPGPMFQAIMIGSPVFSQSDEHVTYTIRHGTQCRVVVDDSIGPPFDGIGIGILYPGRRLDYAIDKRGITSSGHLRLVAVGSKGRGNDPLLRGAPRFHTEDAVTYLARRGTTLYRVLQETK